MLTRDQTTYQLIRAHQLVKHSLNFNHSNLPRWPKSWPFVAYIKNFHRINYYFKTIECWKYIISFNYYCVATLLFLTSSFIVCHIIPNYVVHCYIRSIHILLHVISIIKAICRNTCIHSNFVQNSCVSLDLLSTCSGLSHHQISYLIFWRRLITWVDLKLRIVLTWCRMRACRFYKYLLFLSSPTNTKYEENLKF